MGIIFLRPRKTEGRHMARGEQLLRQWNLLKTLQSYRFGIPADELAERMECNKRTVLRDLRVLREIFPIQSEARDQGRKYWKLPGDFIASEKLQLTMTEMLCLHLSQQLLLPLAGTPFGEAVSSALQKIRSLLPSRALLYFQGLDETFLIKSLPRDDYSGLEEVITALNESILAQRQLRIRYSSASRGREIDSVFDPYGMVLLAASLYVIGYLHEYDEVRTLKVSRLHSARPTGRGFDKPRTFSLAKHTHGAFGVFGPGPVQTVRVRLTGWAATNVRELTWHTSQRVVSDVGETITVEFDLASTVEFKRWVLGFGPHATVLKPRALAREIADELARARENY